jgi:hypothetical protein
MDTIDAPLSGKDDNETVVDVQHSTIMDRLFESLSNEDYVDLLKQTREGLDHYYATGSAEPFMAQLIPWVANWEFGATIYGKGTNGRSNLKPLAQKYLADPELRKSFHA